jgi:hypothetical protein
MAGVACLVCRRVLGPAPPECRCLCSITALLEVRSCHHHRTMCRRPAEAENVSVPLFLILLLCGNNPLVNICICMAEPCRRELSRFCRVVLGWRIKCESRKHSQILHNYSQIRNNAHVRCRSGDHFTQQQSRRRGHGTGGGVAVPCRSSWGRR